MRDIEDRPRRYGNKHARKAALREIGGLTMQDWEALGASVMSLQGLILNSDDINATLRSVKMDSRIRDPNKINLDHMRLAITLTTMGQVDQEGSAIL